MCVCVCVRYGYCRCSHLPHSNVINVFGYILLICYFVYLFIAEVHKVPRPENEQLRNDKRQVGKLPGSNWFGFV